MTGLELATWAAIAVLVLVSSAVFVWFLVDVAREAKRRAAASRPGDDT